MQDRIKEHDRDIRLARTQTSAVSEHANKTGDLQFIVKLSLLIVTLTGQARLLGFFEDTSSTAPLRLKRSGTNHS